MVGKVAPDKHYHFFLLGPQRDKTCLRGILQSERHEPVSSATETSLCIDISLEKS